jgi:hypothetical protein
MSSQLRILISPVGYDDVNSVLNQLGGWFMNTRQLQANEMHLLRDPNFLSQFNHLFLNCHQDFGQNIDSVMADSIRDFVLNGGSVYASDWASGVVEAAFHQRLVFKRRVGHEQTIPATVANKHLATNLGTAVSIRFDMGQWDLIDRFPAWTEVYLWDPSKRPLAIGVKMPKGRIVFTSFHHHAQTQLPQFLTQEALLLQWLVALPTQHANILSVGNVLAQRGAPAASSLVIDRAGSSPQIVHLPFGSKQGVGIIGLSWEEAQGVEFSMGYLARGETVLAEKKSSVPPLVIAVRNPRENDAVEIRSDIASKFPNEVEVSHPYVLGTGLRRDLLGDPDWFAVAIIRHIRKEMGENSSFDRAKASITNAYVSEIISTILEGLGYSTTQEAGEDGPSVLARAQSIDEGLTQIRIAIRVIDLTRNTEEKTRRFENRALKSFQVSDGKLATETELLGVCLSFLTVDIAEVERSDEVSPVLEFEDWKPISSESLPLGRGEETVSAEGFNMSCNLNVTIYRSEHDGEIN